MKLTILGSGTINSAPKRIASGYLLSHNLHTALMDCGPGILIQIKKNGTDVLNIDTLFLSHFHLDHCADVFPLLLNRYLEDTECNQKLTIVGPIGLKHWFETMASLQGSWLHSSLPRLHESNHNFYNWAGLTVTTCLTQHTNSSIAFRFQGEKTFFYSGDSGLSGGLIKFAKDTDSALVECSYPDHQKKEGHLTASECASFASRAQIKNLILTHIYPQNDSDDLLQRVGETYSGPIVVATDFATFEV